MLSDQLLVCKSMFPLTLALRCRPTVNLLYVILLRILHMHRRRMKVFAFVWQEKCIQFLSALAVLPRTILKNRMNSSLTFKSSWCNSSFYSKSSQAKQLAWQRIEYILSPKQQRRPLSSLLSLSFFYGQMALHTSGQNPGLKKCSLLGNLGFNVGNLELQQ